jgi:hypothetical protein
MQSGERFDASVERNRDPAAKAQPILLKETVRFD